MDPLVDPEPQTEAPMTTVSTTPENDTTYIHHAKQAVPLFFDRPSETSSSGHGHAVPEAVHYPGDLYQPAHNFTQHSIRPPSIPMFLDDLQDSARQSTQTELGSFLKEIHIEDSESRRMLELGDRRVSENTDILDMLDSFSRDDPTIDLDTAFPPEQRPNSRIHQHPPLPFSTFHSPHPHMASSLPSPISPVSIVHSLSADSFVVEDATVIEVLPQPGTNADCFYFCNS
jgi:hypothetical protein